ncbi:unnamed protein product [Lactuca virosa]|uniref:Uncharacterized protein n=1 Tax=Lactuca virosa TaxID=75947 RepID=A0AAU9PHC8_9ASTR|nr:unnamed protein product [Lactuca virosa]
MISCKSQVDKLKIVKDHRNLLVEAMFYYVMNQRFFKMSRKKDPPYFSRSVAAHVVVQPIKVYIMIGFGSMGHVIGGAVGGRLIASTLVQGDGTLLATDSYDGQARIWSKDGNIDSEWRVSSISTTNNTYKLSFTCNFQFIFSTTIDGKIKAWLYDNMGSRVDYSAPSHGCTTMPYNVDGSR